MQAAAGAAACRVYRGTCFIDAFYDQGLCRKPLQGTHLPKRYGGRCLFVSLRLASECVRSPLRQLPYSRLLWWVSFSFDIEISIHTIMSAIRVTFFIFLPVILLLGGCALQDDIKSLDRHTVSLAQRTEKLERAIPELEQKNSELKRLNTSLEQQQKSQRAQIESRLGDLLKQQEERDLKLREQLAGLRIMNDRLREEIQHLSGKSEVTDHVLKQRATAYGDIEKKSESQLAQIEALVELNKERIVKLEAYLNFESSERVGIQAAHPDKPGETLSEAELYAAAKQSFDQGEFEKAREGFQTLIKMYPKSNNADNAQFWIGEIYYREKWYEKSILEYQKVIEDYPRGNKVPASLLKQGLAFFNIGDKANARLILKELVKKFPKSNEAKIAEQKLKGLK